MISKKELLAILEKALIAEESSISIYARHLETAVFWTGMGTSDAEKVKKILKVLLSESERHKAAVMGLVRDVKTGDRDAY